MTDRDKLLTAVIILTLMLLGGLGGGYYIYDSLTAELTETRGRLAASTSTVATLESQLKQARRENTDLAERLRQKEKDLTNLTEQVKDSLSDVTTLRKLEKIDEELLQKYSKVYFLNEHYTPSELKLIDSEFVYQDQEVKEIHGQVKPFLEDMLEAAEDDGFDLRVISAYRSFDEQSSLKDHYTVTYGAGTANQFSADQGYSEHQLGTTVDFTTARLGVDNYTSFDQTEAYEWLLDNAHRYGFILSYPEDNQYYIFEPWHWRFVGVELAEDLHDSNETFYTMPQREINKYRAEMFEK